MDTRPVQRPPAPAKKGFGLGKGTLIIGLIIFVAAMFFLPQLLGDDERETGSGSIRDGNDVPADAIPENVLGVEIRDLVVSSGIDQNGCAIERQTSFGVDDTVFIVAQDSDVPAGSTLFVRLYANGQAVEDSQELTADDDYARTCVNFLFEPAGGTNFEAGSYEAELFVNGNPQGTVSFEIA